MHQSLKQKKVENQFGLNRGVVYWHYAGLGVRRTEFDSLHPDKEQTPPSKLYELSHMHRGRGFVAPYILSRNLSEKIPRGNPSLDPRVKNHVGLP